MQPILTLRKQALTNTKTDMTRSYEPSATDSAIATTPVRRHRGRIVRTTLFSLLAISAVLLPNIRLGQVSGISMYPTFHDKQKVLVLKSYRLLSPLKVGDIVIARPTRGEAGGDEVIKRVVFIQNHEGTTPWPRELRSGDGPHRSAEFFPAEALHRRTPKPGEIYLLGDNYEHSMDSRDYGPIQENDILGKVVTFR